ncbi:MAG: hypothetical protein ACLFNL_10055, partial [Bacteroidales bacterium]
MKRTRKDETEEIGYIAEQEPIVLSKALLDLLLKQPNPSPLIALYTFYYYTAKWQKTNQVKATNTFVAKGLKWSIETVKKYKKQLKDIGLIEQVCSRDESGKVTGHYVMVKFVWSKATVGDSIQKHKNPPVGKTHRWKNYATNALSSSSINALSSSSKNKDTNVSYGSYLNHPDSVQKVLDWWNNINTSLNKTTKHIRVDTKVYNQSVTLIDNLLSGLPLVKTKSNRPVKPLENFASRFDLRSELLTKTWTADEIINVLERVVEEDLRENEKRSLPSVFWNNFAARSQAYSLFLIKADQANVPKEYYKLARCYAKIVNPEIDKPHLMVWSKDFEQFINSNGTSVDDVKEVLDWYKDHIDDKFVPKSDDAEEFIFKFRKIKRAMERYKQPEDEQVGDVWSSRPDTHPSDFN